MIFAAIVSLALGYLFLNSESDEEQIRSALRKVEALISYNKEYHPFEQLAKAKEVSRYCVKNCRVHVITTEEEREVVSDRDDVQQKMLFVYRAFDDFKVKASSIRIEVNGNNATVNLRGRATGVQKGQREQFLEEHDIVLEWVKRDDEWLVASARNETPLEMPATYND